MIELPELSYPYDALEPVISAATLHVHHERHHARYVTVTNDLISALGKPAAALEDIIAAAGADRKLFNNAAQAWNHGFFWACMASRHRAPSGPLLDAIERCFASLDTLRTKFIAEGAGHFGSGWVWLVAKGETLEVVSTHDAGTFVAHPGTTPLLGCDLWEHAYYLDHQNDRGAFLAGWWDRLPNWSLAEQQYAAAQGEGPAWSYPPPRDAIAA